MTGLEKILAEISQEAQAAREAALAKANQEAQAILDRAAALTDEEIGRIQEQSQRACDLIAERTEAGADIRRRRVLLETRQRLIKQVMRDTADAIINMPEKEYFEALYKIAQTYAHPHAEGIVYISKRDHGRLPPDFVQRMNAGLPEGAVLTLAEEPRTMYGGMIITYGGVEENCSLRALYSIRRECMLDLADVNMFGPRS